MYYFRANHMHFLVSYRAYEALLEGRTYRLFYTPKSQKLINVEPVLAPT